MKIIDYYYYIGVKRCVQERTRPRGGNSSVGGASDSWSKGSLVRIPAEAAEEFFLSRANFLCWLLFGVRFTPVLPQWHVKDPSQCEESVGGRLH